ncbi:hypothetical protein VE02_04517 [Pseudogymnoascus sp. 03VT05]|nr:hypothetical protein VE02_04517 [Pseudogymnoascus sp. 03VT05]
MIRQDAKRIASNRRAELDHRKKQFAAPKFQEHTYPHRLNFYILPPTADITLEQFEQWAIDRLRVLAELEACSFRNKTPAETAAHMKPLMDKYLPLSSSSSSSPNLALERKKDHYSHFILRLAFASTEDLRRRFARVETALFRLRFQSDDARERGTFVAGLNLEWEAVGEAERKELLPELVAAGQGRKATEMVDEGWFKVDWMKVPELVESRRVLLKGGYAYVPGREQMSMVLAEFTARLDKALEQTSRALPRLDEDDRLSPILAHLSSTFLTPASTAPSSMVAGTITAASIPSLLPNFPLCMSTLGTTLATTHHLKHYARLQYTLFLKGLGLSLADSLQYWRSGFSAVTDDTFNKEYRYNIRHSYGDVGGDGNRRGGGYSPFSCQKILTEHPPGPGEAHGCPYRHYSLENLTATLQRTGVTDGSVLKGVKDDREKMKYHMACNRVFEHVHARELKRAKEEGTNIGGGETIVHPNEYFRRSFLLKVGGVKNEGGAEMEVDG